MSSPPASSGPLAPQGGHNNGAEFVDVARKKEVVDRLLEKLRNAGMEVDDEVARIIDDEIARIKAEAARGHQGVKRKEQDMAVFD
ncbi:hypothetical protein ACP70R_014488 [Stipagrostis hirtigluma subsp. patula]